MTLQLDSEHLQVIFDHAERIYPEECCGILLGHLSDGEQDGNEQDGSVHKTVVEVWETPNTWDEEVETSFSDASSERGHHSLTKARRYWIDPRDMLAAQRYARDRQLNIIGIYHSHPDHPATPSECDRAAAWHHYSYMIISVQHGKANHVLCWTLDDNNQFQSEEIQTAILLKS
jgi:proteasome lid subunit RPN8/RPN11